MTVAVSIAIVAGHALAGQRFYWAVISVLVVLLGTNTLAEQLRKGGERAVGVLVSADGGEPEELRAHKVVLSAGAVNSPTLLMRS